MLINVFSFSYVNTLIIDLTVKNINSYKLNYLIVIYYPFNDDSPALIISSTKRRLLAITVQELIICFLTI